MGLISLLALGCDGAEPDPGVARLAAIVANPDPATFAVYASNSVLLNARARVDGGNVGTRQATGGPHLQAGFEGALSEDARVDPAFGVYADTLRLGVRVVVGNVYTNGLTNLGATSYGVVTPFQTLAAFPATPNITPGASNLTVNSGVTQTINAGNYNNVTVNGRLRLNAGTFRFRNLTVSPDAILEALGAVQVQVRERVSLGDRGRIQLGSGSGLNARDAVYISTGTNNGFGPAGEPSAVHIGTDAVFRGLVFVPTGTYRLGQRSQHSGAVVARDAVIDVDSTFTYEGGFGCGGGCDDGNPCTADSCVLGVCTHTNLANGTACNDGTVCNGQEACNAGVCVSGTPLDPDDDNPCTVDSCDPVLGVQHEPAPAGTPCLDGNACNGAEHCNGAGVCVPGTPLDPDDENPCTADSCDPMSGVVHTPVAEGTPCPDGNVCNGAELCDDAGACQPGVPLDPDDGNPCTFDACDPEDGVSNEPFPAGTSCADDDECDGDETCTSDAQCLGVAPEPLPEECEAEPPVSTRCGDAIRDPVTEECDDGPGTALDACDEECRVTDEPVAPVERITGERLSRTLGYGRHPLATGSRGTLAAFTELEGSERRLLGALFGSRGAPRAFLDLGAGARPSEYADASVAALGPDVFVAAWNDLGAGSLDIALRLVRDESPPSVSGAVLANATVDGAQQDPDVLWTGSELVVAWESEFLIHARRFDANLVPVSDEQQLGLSDELSGSVALARFGSGWAAAWRALDAEGGELVRVHTAGADFSVGPFTPGAAVERPALVELDAEHLLVVFTQGTDPLETGTPSVTRLFGAVLDLEAPGPVEAFPLPSLVAPYDSDETVSQSRPTLARVGSRWFLGWETAMLEADVLASEIWLQELAWTPETGVVYGVERPVQATVTREGFQYAPAFAPSPLFPGGALSLVFEHDVEDWPYAARPDLVFSLRPVPFVTLPEGD